MTPQDLLFIQSRVSNSFLRSFYPNDYRAVERQSNAFVQSTRTETNKIRKTEALTNRLDDRLVKILGLLQKELGQLTDAMDNLNARVTAVQPITSLDVEGALDSSNNSIWEMLGLYSLWRMVKNARTKMRERAKEKAKAREKAKLEEKAKAKAEEKVKAEEKTKAREKAKLEEKAKIDAEKAKANETKVKPTPEEKVPKQTEKLKPPPKEAKGPKNGAAAAEKLAAGQVDDATVAALKQSLKETSNPKETLSLLKKSGNFLKTSSSKTAIFIQKILGSRLLGVGLTVLTAALEAWDGWNEILLVNEAFDKGLIDVNQQRNLITLICVEHGAKFVVGSVIGGIFAQAAGIGGAWVGAGLGAIFGGGVGAAPGAGIGTVIGEIAGFGVGYWVGSIAVDDVVKLFMGAYTIEEIIYGEAQKHAETGANQSPPTPMDKPVAAAPNLSPISSAYADSIQPDDKPATAAQLSQQAEELASTDLSPPVPPPAPATPPARNTLPPPSAAPIPVSSTPSEAPRTETKVDLNATQKQVDTRVTQQLAATPGSQANKQNRPNDANVGADNVDQPSGQTGDVSGIQTSFEKGSGQGAENLKMVTLSTSSGMSYQVNQAFASNFDGFVKALESTGYKIRSIGGYANRNIADSNKKSFHSLGASIDINPKENPVTYGKVITDMPQGISQLAQQFGLGWGGDWNGKKDAMHFSAASAERGAYRIDRNTGAIAMATGAKVHPQKGGTLALIAEDGEPEYVVPQSKVTKFAHEMLAARPTTITKSKRHTHVVVVPVYT